MVVEYLASAPTEAARMVMFVMAGMPDCRRNTRALMGLIGMKGRRSQRQRAMPLS